ncbi:hypothetical protein RJZ90_006699 [Blastomyces dermatitidis]
MAGPEPSTSSSSTPRNIAQRETDDNDLRRRWASEISTRHNTSSAAPNSFDNFARSWQRAAHFPEVAPRRSSFVLALPDDEEHGHRLSIDETRALLRRRSGPGERGLETPFGEAEYLLDYGTVDAEFDISPRTTPLLGRSYEPSYGTTVTSRISESTRLHAAQLHREHQFIEADAAADTDSEREPFIIKRIQHEDGSKEAIIVGQSTVPQTIFNSVNVLIGIGLLSLPLGLMYAGWLIGIPLLIFSAVATAYTAKILAKCMDVDPTLVTYADLAYISFGPQARIVTSLLFCLELMGACVALVVLFADSIDALVPGLGALRWKLICAPWGGHSVFPNIYKDMRHPHKYGVSLWVTYIFTFLLDLAMAVAGWLMFGPNVRDEITSNILRTAGYPNWLSVCIVAFIAIIPLTKVPLSHSPSPFLRTAVQSIARILTICIITFTAIVFPYFDRIMAFIGASLCITICIILPVAFYLRIFGSSIPFWERVVDWVLLGVCSVMAVVGTVWAFIPRERIGLS